jgi:hypothetical protein
MKNCFALTISLICIFLLSAGTALAQSDTAVKIAPKQYVITTNDGGEFMGIILSQDTREVLIETRDRGQVSIPKYQIREMREIKAGDLSATGDYVPAEVFSSRYFITTNGLPIEKKESYILWNLWGPDFEFGIQKNFGLGVMTSWFGTPIIGTIKYSFSPSPGVNVALGGLLGTGSWVDPSFGLALPYGALTLGDRKSNISVSAGYGAIFSDGESNGRFLMSVAGMTKVGKKVCLVFDSLMLPKTSDLDGGGVLIPGIRLQTESRKAFQFGFGAIYANGEFIPAPVPFVQWFRKL